MEPTIPELIEQTNDLDYSRRQDATWQLTRRGREAVEPLEDALNDPRWRVRVHAADALAGIGSPRCVYALLNALTDSAIAEECSRALTRIGSPAALARAVMRLENISLEQKRDAYARLLARRGVNSESLSANYDTFQQRIQREAAFTSVSEVAIEGLIEWLGHADYSVRQKAVRALAARGSAALEPLCGALQDSHWVRRVNALAALGQMRFVWRDIRFAEAVSRVAVEEAVRADALLLMGKAGGTVALALAVLTDTSLPMTRRIAAYDQLRSATRFQPNDTAYGSVVPLPDLLAFCERQQRQIPDAIRQEIATRLMLLRASDSASQGSDTLLRAPEHGPEAADGGELLRPAAAVEAAAPALPSRAGLLARWRRRPEG